MEKEQLIRTSTSKDIPLVEVTWHDLFYQVQMKEKKLEILKGISGSAEPGEFLAIMGSSGAGKTTLLNMLSDRAQKTKFTSFSGEIYANSQSISTIAYKNYIGYVTQEDILFDCMTVKECLMFSARLRINSSFDTISTKVDTLISELSLENCKNTYVGSHMIKGISGGEKKRTSIGIELVTDPSVLFLDEPTSGLDSFTACTVISLLLRQARKGRTIISTIHQPSSDIFLLFDKLLLMSDGHIVYHGQAKEAVVFFERSGFICPPLSNPADYFMEILHIKKPHDLDDEERRIVDTLLKAAGYSSLIEKKNIFELSKLEQKSNSKGATSFLFQFYMNFYRFSVRVLRNPMLSVVKIFILTFIGGMINLFYWQIGKDSASDYRNRNGVLYFITLNLIFGNVQGTVLSFPLMRSLMIKEYNSNMYGISAFFLAKNTVDLIYDIFVSLYFSNLVYWGVGLTHEKFEHVGYFFLFALLIHMSGGSLGLLTGSTFKRPEVAMSFTAITMVPLMYFSGYYRSDTIPTAFRWIENISFYKYGFQGLAKNEWDGVGDPSICLDHNMPKDECRTALDLLGITMSIRESAGLLAMLMIIMRLMALGVLILVVKKNKA